MKRAKLLLTFPLMLGLAILYGIFSALYGFSEFMVDWFKEWRQ